MINGRYKHPRLNYQDALRSSSCIRLIKSVFALSDIRESLSSFTAVTLNRPSGPTSAVEATPHLLHGFLHHVHVLPRHGAGLVEGQALFNLFSQLVAKHGRGEFCRKANV